MGVRNISSCWVTENALLRIPTDWFHSTPKRGRGKLLCMLPSGRSRLISVPNSAHWLDRQMPPESGSVHPWAMNDHGARGLGASGANNLFFYIGVNPTL